MTRSQIINELKAIGFTQEAGLSEASISFYSDSELLALLDFVKEVNAVTVDC